MQMIRDIQFYGRIRSDPHRHVTDFLEVSNLFQYGENQEEAIMLRTFPFLLSGEAKTWMKVLDEGTITSWNELREAFIRILLYNTPNEAFKILDDKVLLKLDFLDDSQNNPKPKTIVTVGGSNITLVHELLMEKFEALAQKIDSEFLIIRKELKEMRDDRRDNHASQIYMSDDTPMCDPMEANYVQGYHDQNSNIPYSNQNRNLNRHYPYPRNRMPHLSQYFERPETSTEEMMREWMGRQTEANERMKDQMVKLENQINQGLRNRQAIIENLERQFEYLEKIQPTESLT
ncbi:hypothetical protein Tco_1299988, partial [Tanacetum coccineum]